MLDIEGANLSQAIYWGSWETEMLRCIYAAFQFPINCVSPFSGPLGFKHLQGIGCNALCDSFCHLIDRVVRQIGVARRRFDIAVAEQLADHRQAGAELQGARGIGMSEVVNSYPPRSRPASAPPGGPRTCLLEGIRSATGGCSEPRHPRSTLEDRKGTIPDDQGLELEHR